MRRARPLLLVLLMAVLGVVGGSYYLRIKAGMESARPVPAAPDRGVVASANDWQRIEWDAHGKRLEIHTKDFRQRDNPPRTELTGVELRVRSKDGKGFDRITSAKAEFDDTTGILYADGDVEIVRNIQDETAPTDKLLKIKTSGVRYDVKSGGLATDRPAAFSYDRADGTCTGAEYNPTTRDLVMKSNVDLRIHGLHAEDPTMVIQAGHLTYKELEKKVYLDPWSRLIRATSTLEGSNAVITLKEVPTPGGGRGHQVDRVDAQNAHGTDRRPERQLDYAAESLVLLFDDTREIREVTGERAARLVSKSAASETTVTAARLQMNFITAKGSSVLDRATAGGNTVVEAKPVGHPGVATPDTKVLHSDTVNIKMKPGGDYLESAETAAPATLDLIPNRPGQRRRRIDGERMWVTYGDENRIKEFHATTVSTRTEPLPRDPKKAKRDGPPPAPAFTWSKVLSALYDDKGQVTRIEQSQDFRYQEGDRQAVATVALIEPVTDLITLDGNARVWDPTGSTSADKIVLNQKANEFVATGNVASSRMPDQTPAATAKTSAATPPAPSSASAPPGAPPGSLLSTNQPLQAKAHRMVSSENNQKIQYDGGAVLWQGANRLEADRVDIDRKEKVLVAQGRVVSQIADQDNKAPQLSPDAKAAVPAKPAAPSAKASTGAPVFTTIKSPSLVYTDKDRLAFYKGGVLLNRPDMEVKSQELRAYLRNEESESGLEKMFADGKVQIDRSGKGRTRQGSSEHAEYYVDDEKVLLTGGQPQFTDNLKGTTRGRQITYYSGEDKLVVDGAEQEPAKSRILRKPGR
jgi:lipopolysaccharide export system protein LptA